MSEKLEKIKIPRGYGKKIAEDIGISYTTIRLLVLGKKEDDTMMEMIKVSLNGLLKIDKKNKIKTIKEKHKKILTQI